jgi:hypothetical protein
MKNFLVRWGVSILIYATAKYLFGESFFAGWMFGVLAVGLSECIRHYQEADEKL